MFLDAEALNILLRFSPPPETFSAAL